MPKLSKSPLLQASLLALSCVFFSLHAQAAAKLDFEPIDEYKLLLKTLKVA